MWEAQREALGGFIRAQRQLADLSLRQLADLTEVSNAYLSQVERGLHQPSVRVLKAVSDALGISTETLFRHAGFDADRPDDDAETGTSAATEAAIRADRNLSDDQKRAMIAVYRSYAANDE